MFRVLDFYLCRRGGVRLPDEFGVPAPFRGCSLSWAIPISVVSLFLLSRLPGIAPRSGDRLNTKKNTDRGATVVKGLITYGSGTD